MVSLLACWCAGCLSSDAPAAKAWTLDAAPSAPAAGVLEGAGKAAFTTTRVGTVSVDAPYDERVYSIVKLLKQLAQEYGQRKRSYKLPRRADGHVLCRTLIIHNASAPPPKLGIGFS